MIDRSDNEDTSIDDNHDKMDIENRTGSETHSPAARRNSGDTSGNKLFVGSLPFSTADDDLKEHFEKAGSVVSAKVITDRETGRSRGFGFVEMSSKEEANNAIKNLNGSDMNGRNITVSEATKKEGSSAGGFKRKEGNGFGPNKRSGFGGGRDGGGRDGGGRDGGGRSRW